MAEPRQVRLGSRHAIPRTRRRAVVSVLLMHVLLLGACGGIGASPTASPVTESGIRGRVLLGPTCPGSSVDLTACLTPYAAQLLVLDAENREVARVRADEDGKFEVALPPGQYTIAPEQGDPYPQALALPVIVVPGEYVHVEVNYDSGIR